MCIVNMWNEIYRKTVALVQLVDVHMGFISCIKSTLILLNLSDSNFQTPIKYH